MWRKQVPDSKVGPAFGLVHRGLGWLPCLGCSFFSGTHAGLLFTTSCCAPVWDSVVDPTGGKLGPGAVLKVAEAPCKALDQLQVWCAYYSTAPTHVWGRKTRLSTHSSSDDVLPGLILASSPGWGAVGSPAGQGARGPKRKLLKIEPAVMWEFLRRSYGYPYGTTPSG